MKTQREGKDTQTMITLKGEKTIGEDRTHKKPPRGSTAFFFLILGTKSIMARGGIAFGLGLL